MRIQSFTPDVQNTCCIITRETRQKKTTLRSYDRTGLTFYGLFSLFNKLSAPNTHSHTHTHTHTHTLSLIHTLSHSHTHSLSLSHTHTLSLSHTHTHTLSLSHAHTLSLTHTRARFSVKFLRAPLYFSLSYNDVGKAVMDPLTLDT